MESRRRKVFDIIQIGRGNDAVSRFFDIFIVVVIGINLFIAFFDTFDESAPFKDVL